VIYFPKGTGFTWNYPEPPLDPPRPITDRKHPVGVESFKFEELKGISGSDLPGRFPITSAQGHAYVTGTV
jgi:hypothetical protein